MLQEDAIVKSMGFALAAAIVFDAFIVRMVLIPALLFLLGEKAWWMPSWLDRVLPHVDVEGEKLDRPHLPAGKHALSETDLDEQPDESDMFV
jgi:putative drug exporter of the RND superfamily